MEIFIYQRYRRAFQVIKSKKETQFLNVARSHAPTRVAEDKSIHTRFNKGIIIRRRCTGKERTEMLGVVSLAVVDILVDRVHPAARQSPFLISEKTDSITWLNLPTDADSLGEREAGNKSDYGRREFTRILPGLRREK